MKTPIHIYILLCLCIIDWFHIAVRMRQTGQISLESALSQRDYNRGGQSSVRCILEQGSSKILDGNISIGYNKVKQNEIVSFKV